MTSPMVAAVLVNWNGKADTLLCLSSLSKVKEHNSDFLVVVVDNASDDGSCESIRTAYPWVKIIELSENRGFAGGTNEGIRYAMSLGASFVWLLNNDTKVDVDVLSFLSVFKDSSVGAAGSKIYFMKGREFHKNRYKKSETGKVIWYAGGIIDWDNMLGFHRGVDEVDHGQYDKIQETQYITGCSFIIRSEVIRKIGLLEDSYFMYLEDLEYSLRIQKAGYKTLYVPSSILWHKNASSSGGSGSQLHEYYQTRNRFVVGMKYAPIRTKIALIREACNTLVKGSSMSKMASRDGLIGRMGKRI